MAKLFVCRQFAFYIKDVQVTVHRHPPIDKCDARIAQASVVNRHFPGALKFAASIPAFMTAPHSRRAMPYTMYRTSNAFVVYFRQSLNMQKES
jgi:hypothetical protein